MTEADRERWDARYRERGPDAVFEPNAWLASLVDRLRPATAGARALDLACGLGANALLLGELGYTVDAWDISPVGLGLLAAEVERRRGLGRSVDVHPREVDLDDVRIEPAAYDLIVDTFFLDRRLFRQMADGLRSGGLLVFETVVDFDPSVAPHMRPAFKLQPGELVNAFPNLEVLSLDEDRTRGTARLMARRA